jgi:tetratricopeptide (TPR) repeat protein
MKKFWAKKKPSSDAAVAERTRQLRLAAFGKHPGWDDHMPGIGTDTENLQSAKRILYDVGIRGQIDSGAWSNLEIGKHCPSFDHILLWLRTGSVILGRMWSSKDGIGRDQYPMALCVDGPEVSSSFMLAKVLPEIEALKSACQQTQSVARVTDECAGAQARLDRLVASLPAGPESLPSPNIHRSFFDDHAFGPEKSRLLRVLHEIENARRSLASRAQTGTVSGLFHIRVPTPGLPLDQAISLWASFFQVAVPESVSRLFLARLGAAWIDVILGEPAPADFFCLQASPESLPLASEIAYAISPELRGDLQEIEKYFMALASGEAPPPPLKASSAKANHAANGSVGGRSQARLIGSLTIVAALAAMTIFLRKRSEPTSQGPPSTLSVAGQQIIQTDQNKTDDKYATALTRAREALDKPDYTNALRSVALALTVKTNDTSALQLQAEIQKRIAAVALETKVMLAIERARQAVSEGRFTNAIDEANAALALTPNDPFALSIKGEAVRKEASRVKDLRAESEFRRLITEARAALNTRNTAVARTTLSVARALRPNDPDIVALERGLQVQATEAQQAAEADRKYQDSIQAAQDALSKNEFLVFDTHIEEALKIRANDERAQALKRKAAAQKELAAFLKDADTAFQKGDFRQSLAHSENALKRFPGNAEVLNRQKRADEALADESEKRFRATLAAAQIAFDQKEFSRASDLVDEALKSRPNQTDATALHTKIRDARVDAQFGAVLEAARIADKERRFVEARQKADEALQLKPNSADALAIRDSAQKAIGSPVAAQSDSGSQTNSPATPRAKAEPTVDWDQKLKVLEVQLGIIRNRDKKILYLGGKPVTELSGYFHYREDMKKTLARIQEAVDDGSLPPETQARVTEVRKKLGN